MKKTTILLLSAVVGVPLLGCGTCVGCGVLGAALPDQPATVAATSEPAAKVKPKPPPKPPEPAIKITAVALVKAYAANEMRADAVFKGKPVQITGVVDNIGSDLFDEPQVNLKGGRSSLLGVSLGGLSKSDAIALNKGARVTFRCTGAGEVMGAPLLSDCEKVN